MKKRWAAGLVAAWICRAQTPPTPEQIDARHQSDPLGNAEQAAAGGGQQGRPFRSSPIAFPPPPAARPTGESVSIAQLRHKVPKAAQKSFARAMKLSKAEDHAGAAMEFEEAIRRDPEFADAYTQLGAEYGTLGRLQEAEAALRHALELEPNSWAARLYLGVALYQAGDLRGAEDNAHRALQDSAENARVQMLVGYLLWRMPGTQAEGLRHMQDAARALPEAKQLLRSLPAR